MPDTKPFVLSTEYEEFAAHGKEALRGNGVTLDNIFPPESDKRRGLGIFFWQKDLVAATQPFLDRIHKEFPDEIVLYGFPGSSARQHITLLELIAVKDRYEEESAALEKQFEEVCRPILEKAQPIRAHFKGFVVNPSCIVMKGYSVDNSFNELRDDLRGAIQKAGLSALQRRKVQIFHTTVARFIKPIEDVERLIDLVEEFKDFEVGGDMFQEAHLVRASWLMADFQTKNLADFTLKVSA